MPPQLDAEQVAALAAEHPHWWSTPGSGEAAGAGMQAGVEAEVLGRGESFTAWLVRHGSEELGSEELVVRVPHRPVAELPLPMTEELAMLGRVPEGLGARPVAVHEPTTGDPRAYLVVGRVPGRVLAPREWTDDLLAALAGQLARLHVRGRVEGLPAGAMPRDLLGAAEGAMAWWREHEPGAARSIEPLWPAVVRHQRAVDEAAPPREQRFVHGDTCLTNILVADGVPRLVDWEWAHAGDPARDLAYAGGRVHADPWYAELSPARVRRQVEAYASARAGLGAPVEVEHVLARRAGWLVNETCFTSAHFRRVADAGGEGAERYREAADQLQGQLADWLT